MEIYDVSGRRVTSVPLGHIEPGVQVARWNGLDMRGNNMPSGVYFVRLRGAEVESRAAKAVLLG
jgi:flagellar hook assembly protein FlgD